MKLVYVGKNIDVTEALKNVTEEKLARLDKYFDEDIISTVTYGTQKDRHTIEVTIDLPQTKIRAEVETFDMYEAIDKAIDILERQVRKYKGKLKTKYRNTDTIRFENIIPMEETIAEEDGPQIVKTKRFTLNPMNAEEAVLQMELIGHDFYVFMNGDTGEANVVYKRKDGNYGLILPEL